MLSLVEANAEMATANIEYRSDMFGRRGDAVLRRLGIHALLRGRQWLLSG